MTEEETTTVEPQAEASQGDQAPDQAAESEGEQTERQEAKAVQASQRRDAEYNFSELRRKVAEQERLIRQQQDAINSLKNPNNEPSLSEDDLLTVKDYKKLDQARVQERAQERLRYEMEILKLKFPDIDQVLSQENLTFFEQNEPELAESLASLSGDPIKMRQAAYKLIKKTLPNTTPSLEKKKAELNAKKPVSVQAVSKSAIGNASLFENDLTPEVKKALWQEMEDARKRG